MTTRPGSIWLVLAIAVGLGCTRSTEPATPVPEADEPASVAPEWQTTSDPEEALGELAEAIFDAFNESTQVEPLVYPKGWVKRKVDPLSVAQDVTRREPDGSPSESTVRLVFQRKHTMIHPDEAAAEADDELIPYPPGPTREGMIDNKLYRAYEPVELSIIYQWDGTTWQRFDWTARPEIGQAQDWLDRLNVP